MEYRGLNIEPGSTVFVTDDEFETLFGPDIAKTTFLLSKYARAICRRCRGECCQRIQCEFQSERFHSCPIYAYRPAKCWLYHCERILEDESLTAAERDLLNRPAVETSQRLKRNWRLQIFVEPPLTIGNVSWLSHVGLDTKVKATMRSLNRGKIAPEAAAARLACVAQRYREKRRMNDCRRSANQ